MEQHTWGTFNLRADGNTLVLRDQAGDDWEVELSFDTPVFFNWCLDVLWFRRAAVQARKLSVRARKIRFIGNAFDKHLLGWRRQTTLLREVLRAQRHTDLERKLGDVCAEIEYEQWSGSFRLTGYGDYGLAECWRSLPPDPAQLFDFYADSLLWGFNEFRKACDHLLRSRTSLEASLERLLNQIPDPYFRRLLPDDIATIVKRIQRVNRRIREGRSIQLVEAVLRLVTTEVGLTADGSFTSGVIFDRSDPCDGSFLSRMRQKPHR